MQAPACDGAISSRARVVSRPCQAAVKMAVHRRFEWFSQYFRLVISALKRGQVTG